jgi:hypothetical protein
MENVIVPSPIAFEKIPNGNLPNTPNIEEIVKNAQTALATITAQVETAKTTAASVEEFQKLAKAALTEAKDKLAEISAVATQMAAAKTQITDAQAVIASKSDHIQKAQEHADKVRADLDRQLTAATQQATEAEAKKSAAQSSADSAAKVLADVRAAKATTDTEAAAVAKSRKSAEESAAISKDLADKSATVEERISNYEKRLAEFDTKCSEQLNTIETLLRGATSAGLAHAFNERRETFLKPHNRWQLLFVSSVLAIVVLTITGLWHVYQTGTAPTYDELIRLWLARLPIAVALVWLALHASRESALAKRLEEDYGYKSAIAACFEGFRKQMSEIGKEVSPDSQLAKLCTNTLTTIATPPGRIYEKHSLVTTPSGELKEITKAAVDVISAAKAK